MEFRPLNVGGACERRVWTRRQCSRVHDRVRDVLGRGGAPEDSMTSDILGARVRPVPDGSVKGLDRDANPARPGRHDAHKTTGSCAP